MKRLPFAVALVLITLSSILVALVSGIAGAVGGVYLYDRGTSKGNDLAVALIGLHSVGTFVFVTVFTFLLRRRGSCSWKVPIGALAACLCALVFDTIRFSPSYDQYFAVFFFAGWGAVGVAGIAALGLCRYILRRADVRGAERPS